MANCKITQLAPPCGYNVQGIASAAVIDFEDFDGLQFSGDALEDVALVEKIYGGASIALPVSSGTKYSSTIAGKIYTHVLDTFVPALSAQLSASLHLATRRKFVVLFTTSSGARFVFGHDNGAKLTYSNQTSDAVGSAVTLSATSRHPLFEVSPQAIIGAPRATFDIDFNLGAFCETY